MSTPADVKLFRHAQRTKHVLRRLDRDNTIPPDKMRALRDSLILFAEHTWGHSASQTDPWQSLVQQLAKRKSKYAIDADVIASELLDDQLAHWGEGDFEVDRPLRYRTINYTDRDRKTLVRLPVDYWETDAIRSGYRVRAGDGAVPRTQLAETLRGTFICFTADIAANDCATFDVELTGQASSNGAGADAVIAGSRFENSYYVLEWNQEGVHSLAPKHAQCGNIIQPGECLGEPVYQLFEGGERSLAAGFGYGSRTKPDGAIYRGAVRSVTVLETGPVFTRLKITYAISGASHYAVTLTLYNGLRTIDMTIDVTKDVVVDPEGLYTAIPFALPGGQWYLDKLGTMMLPGRDQLPGTCCDYYTVTHGAALVNERSAIAISMLDAPLLTIGGIKLWDFTTDIEPVGTLYSWLTNNKWETNFKVECGGLFQYRYIIDCKPTPGDPAAAQQHIIDNSYDVLTVRT